MQITVLGCGTSGGVPQIDTGFLVCDSDNPRNTRFRSSVVVTLRKRNILIDMSPDLRQQLLVNGIQKIDGIFLTHIHADHIHGIDEIRWVNNVIERPIPLFSTKDNLDIVKHRFEYTIYTDRLKKERKKRSFTQFFAPALLPREKHFHEKFVIDSTECMFFPQDHGFSISSGIRMDDFVYTTDVVNFPSESTPYLQGAKVWIVDCLGYKAHPAHAHLEKILQWYDTYKPKLMVLTHMSNHLDYDTLLKELPHGIIPAYDGMMIKEPFISNPI